jgi:riboflavin synthase
VAVDGVSLTVSALTVEGFEVTLIPHTLELTNLGRLRKGSRVNLEADILGKYVRSFLEILRPDGDPVVR